MRTLILTLIYLCANAAISHAQYTAADTLYGSLNPHRTSFDVQSYELSLTIDPARKWIGGSNKIGFQALRPIDTMQLELTDNFEITKILLGEDQLAFDRNGRIFYVYFPESLEGEAAHAIEVFYQGQPRQSDKLPWGGGFAWERDSSGNPYVGVACEGDGASIWWPCKDHLSDEPEQVTMHYTVPDSLVAVGNGRIIDTSAAGPGQVTYSWHVSYPINNYNVTLYVGDYVHFSDNYVGVNDDTLSLDYYVLPYNLEKANAQFEEVHEILEAFEHYFGPYPFYEDGYKLVETNYLGMEHQSAIAYGNQYLEGYLGQDPSGLGFDYIIVHETAHEWFGNSISAEDLAEIWIHESFGTYAEALYVEYLTNYERALNYMMSQRVRISNEHSIVADKGVGSSGQFRGGDKYFKGSWMLQSLRYLLDDDDHWFDLLRSFNRDFFHTITNTEEVINYFEENANGDVAPVMRQFLLHADAPLLQIRNESDGVMLRWKVNEDGFSMPVEYEAEDSEGQYKRVQVGREWTRAGGVDELSIFDVNRRASYFIVREVEE